MNPIYDKETRMVETAIYSYGRIDYTQSSIENNRSSNERPIDTDCHYRRNSIESGKAPEAYIFPRNWLVLAQSAETIPLSFSPIPEFHLKLIAIKCDRQTDCSCVLLQEIKLGLKTIPRNTLIYGVVEFSQPKHGPQYIDT